MGSASCEGMLESQFNYISIEVIWLSKFKDSSKKISTFNLKDGQCSKKCSVVSMPSLVGHIEFMESLKLCLDF